MVLLYVYVIFILPVAVMGYMSRKKSFLTEPLTKVTFSANNLISGPHFSRSLMECGVLCENTFLCDVAEYNHATSTCLLYKDEPFNSLVTQQASGFTVIKGGRKAFTMKFDPATLRSNLYMSPDQTTISDYAHAGVQQFPTGPDTLTYYPGVIVDNCIKTNQIIQYTVEYEYTLQQSLTGTLITIEFGIADRTKVDNSVYSGASSVGGWSFPINKCPWNEVCLEAWHNSVGSLEISWSPNIAGHYMSGSFLCIVNRRDGVFSLYNGSNKIFDFTGVTSAVDLCPVFSVQGHVTGSMTSRIRLLNVQEVT